MTFGILTAREWDVQAVVPFSIETPLHPGPY